MTDAGTRRRLLALTPALALAALLATTPATAQTVVRSTSSADASVGTVTVAPVSQLLEPAMLAATIEVANTTVGSVTLYPRVREVSFDQDGAPLAQGGASPAAADIRLPERITLDAGESAVVRVRLEPTDGRPDVVAVSFDTPGTEQPGPTSWLVFAPPDTAATVDVATAAGDELRATATIRSTAPSVVTLGLRVSGWWGADATSSAEQVVVVGERRVAATFDPPAPGPYRIQATLVDAAGRTTRASVDVVRWDRLPLLLAASALLLTTAALAGRAARRRARAAS